MAIRYLGALIWTLIIIIASGLSKGMVQQLELSDLFSIDKAGHAFVYMVYVILWSWAIVQNTEKSTAIKIAFFTSVFLGILMEILQSTIFTGRSFEYLDIIANISGSFVGMILFNNLFKN